MLHSLQRHPESVCESVTRIEAGVTRQAARLAFRYIVHGNMASLRIPSLAAASRADELWQHTCCEAFVGVEGDAYYEFNWSPSMQWAAYRFSGYRERMPNAEIAAPIVTATVDVDRFELQAIIDCALLAASSSRKWRIGLATVIEETNGRKSYWALTHSPGKPDFHRATGFVIELES